MDCCFFTQAYNHEFFNLTIYFIHVLCKNACVTMSVSFLVRFSLPCRHCVLLTVFADQWPWFSPSCISPSSWNGIINNAEALLVILAINVASDRSGIPNNQINCCLSGGDKMDNKKKSHWVKSTVFYSSCLSANHLKTFLKLGEYLHYLFFLLMRKFPS